MASSIGGFDPLKFVGRIIETPEAEAAGLYEGIEEAVFKNINLSFNPENVRQLNSGLTAAQWRSFQKRIEILSESAALSKEQQGVLREYKDRITSILARTPTPPSPRAGAVGAGVAAAPVPVKKSAAPRLSPREKQAINVLVEQANNTLIRHGKPQRVTPVDIMLHMPFFPDTNSFINKNGYLSVELPFVKQVEKRTGETQTLQLYLQVDDKGNPTGEPVEEVFLSPSERVHFVKWSV